MRILHVNINDISGGAARAANRLHNALRKNGNDSYMIVRKKSGNDKYIIGAKANLFNKGIGYLWNKIDSLPLYRYFKREKTSWSVNWICNLFLIKKIRNLNPDIIHLHWINEGFISIKDIQRISNLGKPIVWTLHDMWAFTGGCHYAGDCKKYRVHCGGCPQLNSRKFKDLSYFLFNNKLNSFNNLCIVTLNNWMKGCVEESKILRSQSIEVIPNSVEINIFKPNKIARDLLNLPLDKKIIAFGAMSSTSDRRKGFEYLKKAMTYLKGDYVLLVFGASESEDIEKLNFETRFMGKIKDDNQLSLIYSAADVFVGPSLEDNLPNTFLESFACGTPVVGFDIGGIPDIIDHRRNGYLAKYKNSKDLAKGIKWCIEDEKRHKMLGNNARKKAIKEYAGSVQAEKFNILYSKLL